MKDTQQGSALRLRFVQVGIVVALFVLLAALGVATYAWFTNNAAVNTNSVSVHSDDSSLVVDWAMRRRVVGRRRGMLRCRRIAPTRLRCIRFPRLI